MLPAQIKRDLAKGRNRRVREGSNSDRLPVRVVEYMITNRDESTETIRLITTIMNPAEAPAVELAVLYHERWEIELTLDEIETHQMAKSRVLRSRTPELVRQEIWALLLAHYAVRSFMREAADDLDIDTDRLSFTRSIQVVRRQVLNQAGFPPDRLQRGVTETLIEIKERPLAQRRNRHYDRVVKRWNSGNKPAKRAHHKQQLYDHPPAIHIFGAA